MDLRITAAQQRRIRGNMDLLLNDRMLSDDDFDSILDSTLGIVGDGVLGGDGMLDAERKLADDERRRTDIPVSDVFSPDNEPDDNFEDIVFEDNDNNGDEMSGPEDAPGSSPESPVEDALPNSDDEGSEPDEKDSDGDGSGFTSVDDQLHDAELPWRPTRPDLKISGDVSDVIPGTVMDRGPLDTGLSHDEKAYQPSLDMRETWISKITGPFRRSLESLLSRWSGFHPAVRIGTAILIVLCVVGLLASMCGHHEKPLPGPSGTMSEPETQSQEEQHQEVTLMPKTVKDFCPARSTHATLAFTDNEKNAWICQRAHGIDGARLEIYFDSPVVVTSICVVPGWNYVEPNGKNHWNEHRLVTKILWRIGGKQIVQNINPVPGGSCLSVPNIATVSMSGVIQATEAPPEVNEGGPLGGLGVESKIDETFAIGKIKIVGYPAGK
jgi:hypothetical protein